MSRYKKGFRSLAFEADDWDLIQFPEEFPLILKYQLGSQWLGTTWILIFRPEKVNEIVVTLLCKFYNPGRYDPHAHDVEMNHRDRSTL